MKKVATTLLAAMLTLSSATTAFAADTPIGPDTQDKAKATTVSYEVKPAYSVTIPNKVTLGTSVSISAEDVVLNNGLVLHVAITAVNGQTGGNFQVELADDQLQYKMYKGSATDGEEISLNTPILTVDPAEGPSGNQALFFQTPADSPKYSGIYTGTVTFTVSTPERPSPVQ